MSMKTINKYWIWTVSTVAILFGLLTIKEGGSVLFWSEEARLAAGQYVTFVLWFNFLAGFMYVIAGLGLWLRRRWAVGIAFVIAAATLAVFIGFGIHITLDGDYELRTIVAMSLRSIVWIVIVLVSRKLLLKPHRSKDGS
ncbi:MAG: hypothetical protein HOH19_00835 [Kordiimonadaceae bacterium]|nr:hypothetical protein [Kordiimonadaceae bacterium]MBT6031094.1 hypothetical protein [Kordiimonadaceae bacterium]